MLEGPSTIPNDFRLPKGIKVRTLNSFLTEATKPVLRVDEVAFSEASSDPADRANRASDARLFLLVQGFLTDGEALKVGNRIQKYAHDKELTSGPAYKEES